MGGLGTGKKRQQSRHGDLKRVDMETEVARHFIMREKGIVDYGLGDPNRIRRLQKTHRRLAVGLDKD